MKTQTLSTAIVAAILSQASATPLEKRADGPIGFGAGTTGGAGGKVVTVTTCAALMSAVQGTAAKIVHVDGILSDCGVVDVGSNTSVLGNGAASGLKGGGFRVKKSENVIFQNLKLGPAGVKGDIIALDLATKVWVDHNEFKSDGLVGSKDAVDGQLDITHASDMITVSWNKFSDHWKSSLVGHSDSNGAEDTGKLHVTYHHNSWTNINSRLPSIRFGTGHMYNSHFADCPTSGINARMGAQVLAENNVFEKVKLALVTDLSSDVDGLICDVGNVLTASTVSVTKKCTFKPDYKYTLDPTDGLAAKIAKGAGCGVVMP